MSSIHRKSGGIAFSWDENKAASNLSKHGVSFEAAMEVFDDPACRLLLERVVNGEERWRAIGASSTIFVMVVAHTYEGEDHEESIRIISARKATRNEKIVYRTGG
jgi:uncharacterized DUF497 family protein